VSNNVTIQLPSGQTKTRVLESGNSISVSSADSVSAIATKILESSNSVSTVTSGAVSAARVLETANLVSAVSNESVSVSVSSAVTQVSSAGADKHYVESFNLFPWVADGAEWYIEFTHSLNKYPSVSVIDTFNRLLTLDVEYIDANRVRIITTSKFSGTVYFN